MFNGSSIEIEQNLRLIMNNASLLKNMKVSALRQREILSYNQIAKESIDCYYDTAPKNIHLMFMNDTLCNPKNAGFERLNS